MVLIRLAEFMEKAQKIKRQGHCGDVLSGGGAGFVATGILILLMVKVVPQFKAVFEKHD